MTKVISLQGWHNVCKYVKYKIYVKYWLQLSNFGHCYTQCFPTDSVFCCLWKLGHGALSTFCGLPSVCVCVCVEGKPVVRSRETTWQRQLHAREAHLTHLTRHLHRTQDCPREGIRPQVQTLTLTTDYMSAIPIFIMINIYHIYR